jgi:hypothetical protein
MASLVCMVTSSDLNKLARTMFLGRSSMFGDTFLHASKKEEACIHFLQA